MEQEEDSLTVGRQSMAFVGDINSKQQQREQNYIEIEKDVGKIT